MKQYIFCAALFAIICSTVGLKEEDCEVCVKTVRKFGESLSEATKKDTKLIEAEFRAFCITAKSKENRFVSLFEVSFL